MKADYVYQKLAINDSITTVRYERYTSEWNVYGLDKDGKYSLPIVLSAPNFDAAHVEVLLKIFFPEYD